MQTMDFAGCDHGDSSDHVGGGSMGQAEWIHVERAYLEELYAEIARLRALVEAAIAADEPNLREASEQLGFAGV
jgi:hypothetical protein